MAGGRPTVMTPEAILKLEEAFAYGATDKEACFYADVSVAAFYVYCEAHPEFQERKEALKDEPIMLARRTVVDKIGESYTNAMDYLSRKRKLEFSQRTESTGKDGQPLAQPVTINYVVPPKPDANDKLQAQC
jgi:hypothetical protein